MTATALLNELRERGFILQPQGSGIKVKPASALSDEQRARIKSFRAELIELLEGRVCSTCSSPLTVESGPGWEHRFCAVATGHFDWWQGLGNWAREQGLKTAQQLIAEAIARIECPECHEPLSCSDSDDVMGCWFCGVSIIGGEIQ